MRRELPFEKTLAAAAALLFIVAASGGCAGGERGGSQWGSQRLHPQGALVPSHLDTAETPEAERVAAGRPSDDEPPTSGRDGTDPRKTGAIEIDDSFVGRGPRQWLDGSVAATFRRVAKGPPGGCSKTSYGACYQSRCTGSMETKTASAGTIFIEGLTLPVTLEDAGDEAYEAFFEHKRLFSGGESVTIVSSGDEVPAFRASMPAPPQPTLVRPSISDSDAIVNASKSTDLELAWTGGGAGLVRVSFQSSAGVFDCDFDARDGLAVVPRDALSRMGRTALMSVTALGTTFVAAGDWGISLTLRTDARLPNGHAASAYLALQ
jgi:hypothetical protein